ncbi:MAG: nuclear transport factor 2 family protein [Planctomycetota bacterium]
MPYVDPARVHEEAEISQLIADQMSAIGAKDIDRIMAPYLEDVVVFDVKPPFRLRGAAALRASWLACLPYFPAACGAEIRELQILAGREVAHANWVWRLTDMGHDGPPRTWMRSSAGYRKIDGRWRIVHEHVSLPFDPVTAQVVFTPHLDS